MSEQEILLWLDKSLGEARYGAYVMLDVNETLADNLESKLRDVAAVVSDRLRRVERRKSLASAMADAAP